jgi:hypothetical protein
MRIDQLVIRATLVAGPGQRSEFCVRVDGDVLALRPALRGLELVVYDFSCWEDGREIRVDQNNIRASFRRSVILAPDAAGQFAEVVLRSQFVVAISFSVSLS